MPSVKGTWRLDVEGKVTYECECGFVAEDATKEDEDANPWSNLADHVAKTHGIQNANVSFS